MCEGNYKNITFQIRRLEKKKVIAIIQLYFHLVSLYRNILKCHNAILQFQISGSCTREWLILLQSLQ